MSIDRDDITAVILAGGQGRRMGGQDKGLIEFDGKPLVAILVERLSQQGVKIVINANRNHDRYRQFGHPVITDALEDYQGPLAGFASAMAAVDSQLYSDAALRRPFAQRRLRGALHRRATGPGKRRFRLHSMANACNPCTP